MALLKEDGSLDIERINKLPLKEYMEEIGDFTEEQYKEYVSKLPINEDKEPMQPIHVDWPIMDESADAYEVINNIGKTVKTNKETP